MARWQQRQPDVVRVCSADPWHAADGLAVRHVRRHEALLDAHDRLAGWPGHACGRQHDHWCAPCMLRGGPSPVLNTGSWSACHVRLAQGTSMVSWLSAPRSCWSHIALVQSLVSQCPPYPGSLQQCAETHSCRGKGRCIRKRRLSSRWVEAAQIQVVYKSCCLSFGVPRQCAQT